MVGAGDFPELCVGGVGVDGFGVANGNVAVDLAVDQENWNSCRLRGIFGGDSGHVEVVLPTRAEKRNLDQRAEDGASDPGAEAKRLSHAIVGDLAESGERRFYGYGAEVRVRVEGLEELRGTHGFGEGKDAARMIVRIWILHRRILRGEEVDPLMDVVALEKAVGGKRAAAHAVSASVGEQDGEMVAEEELCISCHAEAVVGETVEKKDGIAVRIVRTDKPRLEHYSIRRSDRDVFKLSVESAGGLAGVGDLGVSKRMAGRVKCAVGNEDAGDCAESEVESQRQEQAAGCAGSQQMRAWLIVRGWGGGGSVGGPKMGPRQQTPALRTAD